MRGRGFGRKFNNGWGCRTQLYEIIRKHPSFPVLLCPLAPPIIHLEGGREMQLITNRVSQPFVCNEEFSVYVNEWTVSSAGVFAYLNVRLLTSNLSKEKSRFTCTYVCTDHVISPLTVCF